jgi:hypothetical protein
MSSITGILTGIIITVSGGVDGSIDARDILNAGKTIYAIEQKTEQGTWGASAHEESHQIIKDVITEIGRN